MTDDELSGSPLWDALLAPGAADELAGEADALAAFRAAGAADRRRRRLHRVGVGGVGLVLFAAAGGGVAAAYSGNLPTPVQDAVHSALGPIGIPRSDRAHVKRRDLLRTAPRPSPSTTRPVPQATTGPRPTPSPSPTTAPAAGPAASAAPSASASPSSSPTVAPTLTATTSARTVLVHKDVAVTGRLVRGDAPLSGKTVYLARRFPGSDTWARIGRGTTDADGRVRIVATDLTRNVVLRLAGAGVVTGGHPVVVLPDVAVEVTAPGPARRTLSVTTDGAVPQDTVELLRLEGTTWKVVSTHRLDADRATTFTVATPASGETVRYRVRVEATARHGTGVQAVAVRTP